MKLMKLNESLHLTPPKVFFVFLNIFFIRKSVNQKSGGLKSTMDIVLLHLYLDFLTKV